ncbi:MAG: transketolase [Synergistes sp.]|nr:transketolase [Synergistes sp.]
MKVTDEIRNFKADGISAEGVAELQEAARDAKIWTVIATAVAKSGHPAGAISSLYIYLTLLGAANITPKNADSPDRDRIVVSHGHTSAGFYAALAEYGFFPAHEMAANFRRLGSPYQGHVERGVPGVDWGTGNLGQGLAAGVGFALAAKTRGSDSYTWVVMGDGEQVKGQVAESRRVAIKEKLTNISVLVDWNDIQIGGRLGDVMPADIPALWAADGWQVMKCDGHDFNAIYKAMKAAKESTRPTVILCRTTIGKGVSFMEDVSDYHGKPALGDKLEQAVKELGGDFALYLKALEDRKGSLPKGRTVAAEKPVLELGTPHTYTIEDKKDNRSAFGKALAEIGELNYKKEGSTPLLVFDCDLAGSVKTDAFAKVCPDRYIEIGIQEHSAATIAGAASTAGVAALWADFGVFASDEVYNQQRLNDINGAGIKTVLTHTGLDVGEDGMTHQCIDYVGLFRNTFGWRVYVPADPNQTDRATRAMLSEPGCICLAMGRSTLPIVTKEDGTPYYAGDYEFRDGAVDLIRDGSDAVILTMGHLAGRAVEAHDALAAEGIKVKVLHCATPLSMDKEALFALVGDLPLVTCEDHHVETGIGAIAAAAFARAGKAVKIKNLGVSRYGLSGSNADVLADMGLDAAGIAAAVREILK